jgi:hypothetical protein
MPNWYEIPHEQRSPEQRKEARTAHYNTFLKDVEGQQCLADMRRRVLAIEIFCSTKTDLAISAIVLNAFMRNTRYLCGPSDELEIIRTEAEVARREVPDGQPKSAPAGYDPVEFNRDS